MKRTILIAFILTVSIFQLSFAAVSRHSEYFAKGLCSKPGYKCVKVTRGMSWKKMFSNPVHLDIVQRINRTNMRLWRGRMIAVPENLNDLTLHDVSPFPIKIKKREDKLVVVDQDKLAWAAYNADGHLAKWGPISSGKDYCSDIGRSCKTQTGAFYVFNKKGAKCSSNIFPVGRGGAEMPYCMFFYRGFAMHGSNEVPGYRASHGCIRLFTRDAKWLSENFTEVRQPNGSKGTQVIIQEVKKAGRGKRGKKS
jgi:L,D-transpeptidase ErfK/SrfK